MDANRKELVELLLKLGERKICRRAEEYVSKMRDDDVQLLLAAKRERYLRQCEFEKTVAEKQVSEAPEKIIRVPYDTANKRSAGGGKLIIRKGETMS